MNKKKTADQIIDEVLQIYLPDDYYEEIRHKLIPLVKKYAAQETAALREENERLKKAVKELIEIAEERLRRIVNDQLPDYHKIRNGIKSKIENAKKLTGQ